MSSKPVLLFFYLLISISATAQQARLQGMLLSNTGAPLPGGTIRLEPDRHLTQTDDKGRFIFTRLYEGTYTLYDSHAGFVTDSQQAIIQSGANSPLTITLQPGFTQLDEVTVTGSGHETNPDNLLNLQRSAMPVTVITRETIERMSSRRLDELLKEQTGLAIVSDISGGARATGVQMQGFGSAYVMILIDGQPMVGRNSGNFDLSRISVTNIERIEIIKGASSCLFGSEALCGAINIVTRYGAVQPQGTGSLAAW